MTRVALDRRIAQLEPSGRELLRLLTAFEHSIPVAVAADLGILAGITDRARGMEAIERMITLGLVDLSLRPASRPGAREISRSDEREIAVNQLAAPGINVLELGLIDTAGHFELLPIDRRDKPLWSEVTHLLVTTSEAERQRGIVLRSYRILCDRIAEVEALRSSVAEWSHRRVAHPVFGTIRFETIETWKSMRQGTEPLSECALDRLYAEVARRVAARIGARLVR